jgi:alkylation response protein AidB-like acyl-CoA dehydrogenase
VWKAAQRIAAEEGLVAIAYERRDHEHSRVHQFVANYLVQASLDVYACPLAMTDGAARTLLDLEHRGLIERALPRLTSRDPARMWTSGQWMTERTGGSDVGLSETLAKVGSDGQHRLYGAKWFTSAATSDMTLTLARPEGNGAGGKGLALYYAEMRLPDGSYNGIRVNRLKDKLGTRKLPTAELELEGTIAIPVAGNSDGIRNITSMLNITRTWNSVAAAWGVRRAVALACDYARRRVQFGARLVDKPLHVDTLAAAVAESNAAFLLAFRVVELLGRNESGVATDEEKLLSRLMTPIAKLTTGKQVAEVSFECVESFGGNGYVEDNGLPQLLRDNQVLPLWEGTTNVLSLDALRALGKEGVLAAYIAEVTRLAATAKDAGLRDSAAAATSAVQRAAAWVGEAIASPDKHAVESGARRFALTLGRALEQALLVAHAQWCLDHGHGPRAAAAARRFTQQGIDALRHVDAADCALLV